ncbi:hypothetical protein Tco_1165502 [Tanacetum coccineum]
MLSVRYLSLSVSKSCSACFKVFTRDIYGDHVVSCVGIIGIKHRHNVVRDTLVDICFRSGISAGKEVDIDLGVGCDKPLRPADMLLYSWDEGLDVCVDFTGSSPLTQTGMVDFVPGRAMTDATHCKRVKYEAKCANIRYGFLPFSFSSLGELEKDAVNLLKRVRKFSVTQDIGARAIVHIFNRIGFAIAKGVGAQLVSRLPTNFLITFKVLFSSRQVWDYVIKEEDGSWSDYNPVQRVGELCRSIDLLLHGLQRASGCVGSSSNGSKCSSSSEDQSDLTSSSSSDVSMKNVWLLMKNTLLNIIVYVDDIIFGSTNKELLQQKEDGIFISQDKYVAEILKKFNYSDVKSASTLVDLEKPLVKDGDADDVDVLLYRSMIGSLMYLTASRPDIMFAVCACARFQVTPKTSHLLAVKRIFRYLKGKPTLGLWYSRDSPFELVAYTDSDYAGATQDRKSTTEGCQFLGNRLIYWQCKKQTVVATLKLNMWLLLVTVDKYSRFKTNCWIMGISKEVETPRYLSLVVPLKKVGDEAVYKELGDRMERAATTASSLEAEQDSGSGPKCQDTILGDVNAQTRFEIASKQSNDPPLSRGYTLRNGEDINAAEHTVSTAGILYCSLQAYVGFQINAVRQMLLACPVQVPAAEGVHLKKHPKQGMSISNIDADVEVTLVDETQERQDDKLMFDTGVLDTNEMPVEAKVDEKDEHSTKLEDSTAGEVVTTASVEDSAAPTTIEEITLAQTLIQIKAAKPKVEPSEFRVPQEAQPLISNDKGKCIMVKLEVPLKRKDQISLDEQIARDIQDKLDAELIEEQKLARKQEEEANIELIEPWENTQAMMEADRLLAERLQSKEREELTDEEKGKLFMELMEKKRKHFATLRAQEKRNIPPTKA